MADFNSMVLNETQEAVIERALRARMHALYAAVDTASQWYKTKDDDYVTALYSEAEAIRDLLLKAGTHLVG